MEILGLISSIVLFAVISSKLDYEIIENGEKVDHIKSWIFRAVFGLSLYLTFTSSICIPVIVLISFLFSAVFRYYLNYLRSKKFDYISTSNFYDSIFIRIFGQSGGKAAYVFELSLSIISILLILF